MSLYIGGSHKNWFCRFVLSYRLSNSLETDFCLNAFEKTIEQHGKPKIFNTDQGRNLVARNLFRRLYGKISALAWMDDLDNVL
jgi:transposase InsO family protein